MRYSHKQHFNVFFFTHKSTTCITIMLGFCEFLNALWSLFLIKWYTSIWYCQDNKNMNMKSPHIRKLSTCHWAITHFSSLWTRIDIWACHCVNIKFKVSKVCIWLWPDLEDACLKYNTCIVIFFLFFKFHSSKGSAGEEWPRNKRLKLVSRRAETRCLDLTIRSDFKRGKSNAVRTCKIWVKKCFCFRLMRKIKWLE